MPHVVSPRTPLYWGRDDGGRAPRRLSGSGGAARLDLLDPRSRCASSAAGFRFTLPSRVFGLPKRHVIEHAAADSDDHLTFHLWAFSFFTGMRLIATEAGFVDATRRR